MHLIARGLALNKKGPSAAKRRAPSTGETADAVTFILTIKNQIVKTFSERKLQHIADFCKRSKSLKTSRLLRDLDGRIC